MQDALSLGDAPYFLCNTSLPLFLFSHFSATVTFCPQGSAVCLFVLTNADSAPEGADPRPPLRSTESFSSAFSASDSACSLDRVDTAELEGSPEPERCVVTTRQFTHTYIPVQESMLEMQLP